MEEQDGTARNPAPNEKFVSETQAGHFASAKRGAATTALSEGIAADAAPAVQPGTQVVPIPGQSATRSQPDDKVPDRQPVHQGATVEPPLPDPLKASTTHEIKLQLNGGDQRVEVQLTDRGGDVHVAVRTADSHLAGALREDLPSLSARLEQNGFHTENWHTGMAASPARGRMADTPASATPQEQQNNAGQGRDRRDSPEQQSKDRQNPNRKDERKDFAWLFTSLR